MYLNDTWMWSTFNNSEAKIVMDMKKMGKAFKEGMDERDEC